MSYRKHPNARPAKAQLDERRYREADLRTRIVVGPGPGAGLWTVHDTHDAGSEEVVSEGVIRRSLRPGEVVMTGSEEAGYGSKVILSAAPARRRGTAQFAFPALTGAEHDALGIIEADPNVIQAGVENQATTLAGFGFNADPLDVFRSVVYNTETKVWDDDPLVTLGDVTWASAEEVSLPISVSSSAPAGYRINIEVTRA